jgi:putative hydrolase of the HAD superfamily
MPYQTILFDLDDTLYSPATGIWDLIGERIDLFINSRIGLDMEKVPALRKRLFATYGTTLLGLVHEYGIDREDYLAFVHNVPVEEILASDDRLRTLLFAIPYRKIIFTNSDHHYAGRVLRALGVEDCFSQIIDILDIWPNCKPQPEAFQKALVLADNPTPSELILLDDTPANVIAASQMGIFSILVGDKQSRGVFDRRISSIYSLSQVLPDGYL